LTMADGAAAYIYTWTPDPGIGNSNTATDLPADSYNITIQLQGDVNCVMDTTIVIDDLPTPTANVTVGPATCEQANGEATFTPANYTYAWSDNGVGAVRDDLTFGTYTVTFTDPNTGCFDSTQVVIDSINNLIVLTQITHPGLMVQ